MMVLRAVAAVTIQVCFMSIPLCGQAQVTQLESARIRSEGDSGSGTGWVRPVASAIVPGSGQLMAGQDRGAIYLVAEVFLWTRYLTRSNEGGRERDNYRNLAFDVARAPFSPARRDTTFKYCTASATT